MGRWRVVDRGAGVDRLQEVQPLLHQRQGRDAAVSATGDGVGWLGGGHVAGGGGSRLLGGLSGRLAFASLQPGSQLQRRRGLEQRRQRKLAAQFTTQRLQQLGGQQRMTTHGEEVVVVGHFGQAQVFGHQRAHAGQQRGRRGSSLCGRAGRRGRRGGCGDRGSSRFARRCRGRAGSGCAGTGAGGRFG